MGDRWQRVAAEQDWLLHRDQAHSAGLSRAFVRHRVESGAWREVVRGVVATFSGELTVPQRRRAALLFAGERAMLHEQTACEVWGVRYLPADDGRVHVLVPKRIQRRAAGFVVVHRTEAVPRFVLRGGLPIAPAGRAGVDLCRRLGSLRDVRAILSDIVQRRLAALDDLARLVDSGHSAGSRLARLAVDDLVAGCRSAPECDVRDVVRRSVVLPEPMWKRRRALGRGHGPRLC